MGKEDKLKPTCYFVWERMWRNEKRVWIFFLIAIIIILAYHLMTVANILDIVAACIYNVVDWVLSFLSNIGIKKLLYTLAISYVSGIAVYYLTVLLPEVKRSKPILVEIEQSLKYLIDDIYKELEFINLGNAVEIAMRYIERHCKQEDGFYSLKCTNPIQRKIHLSFDALTSYILSFPSALSSSELDALVDIRHRKISQRIKYKYEESEKLSKEAVETDVREFVQLNKDIIALHEQIRNRIYKQ